ncbi:MAG: hypothetical protein AAGF12_02750 [Myxococcota bacterium]
MKRRPPASEQRARRELERARDHLFSELLPPGAPVDPWLPLYHRRICDYLLANLEPARLGHWTDAHFALHQLVMEAWTRRRPGRCLELQEQAAWSRVDPYAHMNSIDACRSRRRLLVPEELWRHYDGFIAFVAARGAMTRATETRLRREYRVLLSDPTYTMVS